jgi:hypothetical protein
MSFLNQNASKIFGEGIMVILTTTIRKVIIDGTSFLADSEEEGG